MTATHIHASSVVSPKAKIGAGVSIGPFCVVGDNVSIGDGTVLHSHVVVDGRTTIGANNTIFPFASIGTRPQDLKFHGEESTLIIGDRNMIREHVTMNPGTEGGGMKTVVGSDCLFMMSAHVAHDCIVGNHVILANNATLAGHVTVGDYAILGGLSAVHQFVRIGAHAMIGGMSGVEYDVIPYGLVMGERARLAGLNLVGLERRGFAREDINTLMKGFKELFYGQGTFAQRLQAVNDHHQGQGLLGDVLTFATTKNSRPLCQPQQK
ncbi:MAG: acyl-ACP--UDP-N-acetylglucosamine O-acyltransferase [Alphaproteobacteria bacterium]|nr:acyl-ACP--UDP-N-acetylglucosamine O-acyltransferase [Alphaproteobacteria bacterium]